MLRPIIYTTLAFSAMVAYGEIVNECQREGMIAFTYDQGPSPYTGILLTTLKKAGVKATFHVVPDYLDNPVLSANLRRAASDGHLIGLFVKENIEEDQIQDYLKRSSAALKKYINYQPQFLRFPMPGPSASMLKKVTALGYKVTSFNLDSLDYSFIGDSTNADGEGSVSQTIKNTLDQIVPPTLGSFIVVQRDIVQASVMQTAAILADVKRRGYKPVRLDTCIGSLQVTKGDGADDAASGKVSGEQIPDDGDEDAGRRKKLKGMTGGEAKRSVLILYSISAFILIFFS